LIVGGIVDQRAGRTKYALKIPGGLSLLVDHSLTTEVPGLDRVPREHWPNVAAVHWSFDVMVGSGMIMLLVAIWAGLQAWRKRLFESGWLLRMFVITAPLGFIAIEAGWFVTEFGRQPWIIYGIMRTAEAVSPMPNLVIPFTLFTAVYLFLSVVLVFLLRRQFLSTASGEMPRRYGS